MLTFTDRVLVKIPNFFKLYSKNLKLFVLGTDVCLLIFDFSAKSKIFKSYGGRECYQLTFNTGT